jgi:hypothetical protein
LRQKQGLRTKPARSHASRFESFSTRGGAIFDTTKRSFSLQLTSQTPDTHPSLTVSWSGRPSGCCRVLEDLLCVKDSMVHSHGALALITVLISGTCLASYAFSTGGRSFVAGRIAAANRRGRDVQFVHVPLSTRLHALGASNENGSIENLKKATVSLAVALALAGGPLSVAVTPDVAFAVPAATSTSAVIPEQQAIADAQASADAASKRLDATRKELSAVQSAFKSAEASYTKANQEATRVKAAFLSANDALSAAKSSKSKDASRIAALTTKVGTYL